MRNLYWKSQGQTRTLAEKPFATEAELEEYVFHNQEILGDISIIYRQIRTGSRQGIPDMLGVAFHASFQRPLSLAARRASTN
jgi:hypothetical protein